MDVKEARRRCEKVGASMLECLDDIAELWNSQAWTLLGYGSWSEMCDAEWPFRIDLDKDGRERAVAYLKARGSMSRRSIAKALGVDERTVRRTRRATSPEFPTAAFAAVGNSTASRSDNKTRSRGADMRSRPDRVATPEEMIERQGRQLALRRQGMSNRHELAAELGISLGTLARDWDDIRARGEAPDFPAKRNRRAAVVVGSSSQPEEPLAPPVPPAPPAPPTTTSQVYAEDQLLKHVRIIVEIIDRRRALSALGTNLREAQANNDQAWVNAAISDLARATALLTQASDMAVDFGRPHLVESTCEPTTTDAVVSSMHANGHIRHA